MAVATCRYCGHSLVAHNARNCQKCGRLQPAVQVGILSKEEFGELWRSAPKAMAAAKKAATDAGALQPQGLKEGMLANWMDNHNQSWANTPVAQKRLQQLASEKAREGADAYVLGQLGNAYTTFLRGRFGPFPGTERQVEKYPTEFSKSGTGCLVVLMAVAVTSAAIIVAS